MTETQTRPLSRRELLRDHVATTVGRWQWELLHGSDSQRARIRARLAELRRAPLDAPGSDFEAALLTVGELPERLLGKEGRAIPSERAAHVALCLYAHHQQSSASSVHSRGVRLGAAAGELSRRGVTDRNEGVVRRFKAIAAGQTFDDAVYHLSMFVDLLGSSHPALGFDYGELAADLLDLQDPERRDTVQLRWARDFSRRPRGAGPDEGSAEPSTTPDEGEAS